MGRSGKTRGKALDAFVPVGALLFAAFVFFAVWGWISIGPAQAWRTGTCAANAPIAASCRTVGTATVTDGFTHSAEGVSGRSVYGVTYVGHGRIPNYTAIYTWGNTTSAFVPLPKKGQEIGVTTWQGRPVTISFDGHIATISSSPDHDARTVTIFTSVVAFAAVVIAMVGRPLPLTRKAVRALRVVDWAWLPMLAAGYVLVVNNLYVAGNLMIDLACVLAFTVSQALRVRLVLHESRHGVEVRDDPASAPPPGVRAERNARRDGGCPVAEADREWIESALRSLRTEFLLGAKGRPTIVPHKAFYPIAYSDDTLEVDELVRKVCGMMMVDFGDVQVRLAEPTAGAECTPFAGHITEARYSGEKSVYVLELDATLIDQPRALTAVLAHKLAHVRLNSRPRPAGRAPRRTADDRARTGAVRRARHFPP